MLRLLFVQIGRVKWGFPSMEAEEHAVLEYTDGERATSDS